MKKKWSVFILVFSAVLMLAYITKVIYTGYIQMQSDYRQLEINLNKERNKSTEVKNKFEAINREFEEWKKSDQVLINKELADKINEIEKSFKVSYEMYEKILDLESSPTKVVKLKETWSEILKILSKSDYNLANTKLELLAQSIKKAEAEVAAAAAVKIPANIPVKDQPPASGQAKQVVKTENGDFVVTIISANLSTTKLVVDTASDKDCRNDCPVLPLGEFAKRSGAIAAINGPYFCPATYPSCSDKKNSFDTLLMNKNKTYFNSDNNVYSSNPVAIFSSGSRFVEKGMEWGRDTGVDSVIMGRPLLVFNGEVKFFGNNDSKETSKGNRTFIGATDNTVYIGVVHSVTVAEAAKVIAKMGIKNAINLDSGGSVALWSNGRYLLGPGRDLPFGLLLVRR